MPFVLVNKEGKYLKRSSTGSPRKRQWIDDLNEATSWSTTGAAINAAHQANNQYRDIGEIRIKMIRLIPGPIVRSIKPKKTR